MSCLVKIESLCGRESLLITYSKSNHHWDCCIISIGWYVVVNWSSLKRESFAKLSLNMLFGKLLIALRMILIDFSLLC